MNSPRYELRLNKRWQKRWEALEETMPETMEKCLKFLQETPEDRLKSNGKLKSLKGNLKGLLQYDITDEARVWYWVDSKERIVFVKYVGHHP